MSIFAALVFGVVQGLTEFLPVSSSGHLALLGVLFGLGEHTVLTAVLLHVATFLSVCVVMRKEILALIKKPFSPLGRKLIYASVASAMFVFLFKGAAERAFSDISVLPWFFLLTAALLAASEMFGNIFIKRKKLNTRHALIIGAMQGMAVLPAVSRSGSTISAALFCGVEREEAANFSFLLSMPIIAASALYELIKLKEVPVKNFAVLPNILAFAVAFAVGIFAIKTMRHFINKAKLWWFGLYLVVVAIVLFLV